MTNETPRRIAERKMERFRSILNADPPMAFEEVERAALTQDDLKDLVESRTADKLKGVDSSALGRAMHLTGDIGKIAALARIEDLKSASYYALTLLHIAAIDFFGYGPGPEVFQSVASPIKYDDQINLSVYKTALSREIKDLDTLAKRVGELDENEPVFGTATYRVRHLITLSIRILEQVADWLEEVVPAAA